MAHRLANPPTTRLFLPLLAAVLCLSTRGSGTPPIQPPFAQIMPATVVWAWEESEDLRSAPAASVGVAYLAETLVLRSNHSPQPSLQIVHRHQPLLVAPGAAVMAVVRIIAAPGFRDTPEARRETTDALAAFAQQAPARALQIDFDATRSQRAFYTGVLRQLRPRMPAAMPLSITALLSWCSAGRADEDWLAALPIDEAVPMFFRLGGSALPAADKSGYRMRDPRCQASLGISTDESWPPLNPRARLYIFAPRPWTHVQLAALQQVAQGPRALPLQQEADPARRQPNDTGLPPLSPTAATSENRMEPLP